MCSSYQYYLIIIVVFMKILKFGGYISGVSVMGWGWWREDIFRNQNHSNMVLDDGTRREATQKVSSTSEHYYFF